MTAVFVHGVPETPAVWEPLVAHLEGRDVALLQMPGFGCPLPDGFEPTMHAYADWLALELSAFDEVDLVAHDWGGHPVPQGARRPARERPLVGARHG